MEQEQEKEGAKACFRKTANAFSKLSKAMSKKRVTTLNEARWRYWQAHFKEVDELEKSLQRLMPFQDPKVGSLHNYYVQCRVQLRVIISEARERVDADNAAKARDRAAKRGAK